MSQLISKDLLDTSTAGIMFPALIQNLIQDKTVLPLQANCLNVLREMNTPFLNLGNVVYCPKQQLLLIFKARYLYAYEFIQNLSN